MELNSLIETPAAWTIAAINVVFFLTALTKGDTTNPDVLIRCGATERERIWYEGESWRLVTSMFMHVGWIHLIMNVYGMFGICQHVELELGTVPFVLSYLLTGIGASAVSVIGHRAISAGASGAGFGMAGVVLMIVYRNLGSSWDAFFNDEWVLNTLARLGMWLLLGIFILRFLDNWAHAGGLFFGLMAGFALTIDEQSGARIPVIIGVLVVWFAVVGASLSPKFARHPHDHGV